MEDPGVAHRAPAELAYVLTVVRVPLSECARNEPAKREERLPGDRQERKQADAPRVFHR